MKKILLVLTVFVLSISAYSQKLPKVSIFLTAGTSKQYNLADIDKINIIGTSGYMMNIYYQHTQTSNFQTKNIDSIRFEKDSKTNDIISIYHSGSPTSFLLSETDSISFYIPSTPVAELTCLNPPQAKIGDIISICGNNFGTTQGKSTIVFNGIISKTFKSWADTLITAFVPEGAMTGKVYLTINGIQTNNEDLTILPHISSLVQTSGGIGDTISIIGNGFGLPSKSSFVLFTGNQANSYPFWNDTVINVVVPKGAQSGLISVNASNIKSNEVNFTVIPKIANVNPNSANIGDTIKIYGYNFGTKQDSIHFVSFTSKNADKYINWSDTLITVKVPAGAKTGVVFANIGKVTTNNYNFTVLPKIIALTPDTLGASESMVISGSGFGDTQGTSSVLYNNIPGIVTNWKDTEIRVTVPDGSLSGNLSVKVGDNISNQIAYYLIQHISGITPTSAKNGDQITINGSNFGNNPGTVIFNDVNIVSSFDGWSDTQIILKVPHNAFNGSIKVRVNNKNSNMVQFQVVPQISGINPTSAFLGATVTINGIGFDTTSAGKSVSFGSGSQNTFVNWNDSVIVVKVPNTATSGKVTVISGQNSSNGLDFTVLPTILSISPPAGGAGDQITITGVSFGSSPGKVSFTGADAAPSDIIWGETQIQVKVPTGALSGAVTVTTSSQLTSNSVNFSVAPYISGINPTSGAVGDVITISGSNFGSTQGSSYVTFNTTKPALTDYTNWGNSQITVKVPKGTRSGKVTVTNNGTTSNGVDFTINAGAYEEVTIGTQTWMLKNWDGTTYANGDAIPEVTDFNEWINLTTGAWCYYNNDQSNNDAYGKLYNSAAVNDSRGIAPQGWHVPSFDEWKTLSDYLGGASSAGGPLKESGTTHWNSPNTGATNESGFTALPAGCLNVAQGFTVLQLQGGWWTSTEDGVTWWAYFVSYNNAKLQSTSLHKKSGVSLRFIKD